MLDALCQFGVNTTEDMDMVAQIKKEVRKLCTRNIIATQIMMDETDELTRENMERLICESDKEIEVWRNKENITQIIILCLFLFLKSVIVVHYLLFPPFYLHLLSS